MDLDQVIIPAPERAEGYAPASLALSSPRAVQGTLFRKHILSRGTLIHPQTAERITIDDGFVGSLIKNFNNQVCDSVAVPLADSQNHHSEDPLRNLGEVVGLEDKGGKVYALMDIRRGDAAKEMGKTLLGASAFLSLNYKDTSTGERVGPALLHTCVTNRPYLTDLAPYEEVIAATADGMSDAVVLTPEDEMPLSREDLIAALRDEHGIDVEALQQAAASQAQLGELTAALTAQLRQGGATLPQGDGDGTVALTMDDLAGAIAELAAMREADAATIVALTGENAAAEVDGYIAQGRVLPRQREVFIRLAAEDRDTLEQLLPDKPIVALAAQRGVAVSPLGEEGRGTVDVDGEIARLTASTHTSRFFAGTAK